MEGLASQTSPPTRSKPLRTQSNTGHPGSIKSASPNTPKRILLPVSRLPHYTPSVSSAVIAQVLANYNQDASTQSPRHKHGVSKLTRSSRTPTVSASGIDILANIPSASSAGATSNQGSRAKSGSISPSSSIRRGLCASEQTGRPSWVQEHLGNFEIIQDCEELCGFQLYAVEKWVVQRTKLLTTIVVYTGDEKDKIWVTVLRPSEDSLDELNIAVQKLRQDGARPKETAKGIIMTTFLPNFRPDLTIVQIPGGNFRAIQNQFYANIDLLRMGCTGRSALTLDEPYESTKEKFIQIYHFPEYIAQHPNLSTSTKTGPNTPITPTPSSSLHGTNSLLSASGSGIKSGKSSRFSHNEGPPVFQATVLNFVKLVQSALSLFGLFDVAEEERDGLLCDVTVDGIRKCIQTISSLVDIVPTERVLDPSAVAAIFSLVISVRNKLHALGFSHRADSKHHSHSSSTTSLSSTTRHRTITPYLTYDLIKRINRVYSEKNRSPEPYKVHRVIKHKIDDSIALASNISESLASNISGGLRSSASALGLRSGGTVFDNPSLGVEHAAALGSLETPTTDLEAFSRMVLASHGGSSFSKEGSGGAVDSLRYVWSGRKNAGIREKERQERGRELVEEQRERLRERDRDREGTAKGKEREDRVKSEGEDGSTSFGVPGLLWKGTGKLIGNSIAELRMSRQRKNTDIQSDPESITGTQQPSHNRHANLPSLMITDASQPDVPSTLPSPKDFVFPPISGLPSPALAPLTAPPSSSQVNFQFDTTSRGNARDPFQLRPHSAHDGPLSSASYAKNWADEISSGIRKARRRRNLTDEYDDGKEDEDLWDDDMYLYDETGVRDGAAEDAYELEWWTLIETTKRTNKTLEQRVFELELAYSTIDERAQQLHLSTRYTRGRIEDLTQSAMGLDYRMNELQRGTKRLDLTLHGYHKRTKASMISADAVGANALLKIDDDEATGNGREAGVDQEHKDAGSPARSTSADNETPAQLRHRHPNVARE
ncbi:hypothetical protein FRB99_005674 [Tulasnella sp. 403]|nr:hypothetical protein FRB99_005674 [Tulasnella sp. 403]